MKLSLTGKKKNQSENPTLTPAFASPCPASIDVAHCGERGGSSTLILFSTSSLKHRPCPVSAAFP